MKQIALSEAELWDELKSNSFWYKPDEHDKWSVKSAQVVVPVVCGEFVGGEISHVAWQCPHCGEEHLSDVEDKAGIALWFCEKSNDERMAFVTWKEA